MKERVISLEKVVSLDENNANFVRGVRDGS